LFVVDQSLAGVRQGVLHYLLRRADRHDLAARIAALGAEIDQPVGGADHVEVVLDHHDRVARGEELAERGEQLRDVLEVQARGRLVEEEEARLLPVGLGLGTARQHRDGASGASARWPASLRRCASPPESVGTGWPERR
jgi:hypothetical protein